MEYTNRFKLPQEIVTALTKNRYNPDNEDIGDYSVSTLIAPTQLTVLKRRYPDKQVIPDVIDNFWAFMGSIAHKVLEEAGTDESLQEKRFFTEVLGKKISGQVDLYKNGTIRDYKTTKVYKIQKGDFLDWEIQLNLYAWLARKYGFTIDRIEVYAFIFDHKKSEVYKENYPQAPIVCIPLRLWSDHECLVYVNQKVAELIMAEGEDTTLLKNIFPCSPRDMWQDVKDWAAIKPGANRASKVFKSEEESLTYELKSGEVLIKRMTERTRCFGYCPMRNICEQHRLLCIEEGKEPPSGETEGLIF